MCMIQDIVSSATRSQKPEGVVACTVRAREQGRAGQNRFPRGTEGARLSEWCRGPCGINLSALCMFGVGEMRRAAVRVQRVTQSMMTPEAKKKERSGVPSDWVTACLQLGK